MGGLKDSATATSTAPDAVTANNATTQVRSGEQVTVAEVLPAGNTGSYTTEAGVHERGGPERAGPVPDAEQLGGVHVHEYPDAELGDVA